MKKHNCFIAVLVIALLVAGGVFAAAKDKRPEGAGKVLPASGEIKGWKTDGEISAYESEDLWEYINGAAEHFLVYGFRKALVRHYIDTGGIELKVEIYEHENDLLAFGIYSQHRSPGATILDFGNEAFGDELSLHFWQGNLFVRIYGYEEGDKTDEAIKAFAASICGKVTPPGSAPPDLALFPEEGMVAHSTTYLTEGVLGTGKLPPAFTARYEQGGGNGRLYIIPRETEREAREIFDWYAGEIGVETVKARCGDIEYMKGMGEAPYRGRVVFFVSGRRVGILSGFGGDGSIEKALVSKAVAKFHKLGGELIR